MAVVMFTTRARVKLCVWAVVAVLIAQCVLVYRAQRRTLREVDARLAALEERIRSAFAAAADAAVARVGDLLSSLPDTSDARTVADAPVVRRVVGRGCNGYYAYTDFAYTDEEGVETTQREYVRLPASLRDPRPARDRRPSGY